jgi:acetyltransferase-like isoleucine patch superfamily enzyme
VVAGLLVAALAVTGAEAAPARQLVEPTAGENFELLTAEGRVDVPVKARFFGKRAKLRSDSFAVGGPATEGPNEAGPFEIGDANFVLSLVGPAGAPAEEMTIPIQIVELSLQSTTSVKVRLKGETRRWSVRMGLSDASPQPIGELVMTPGEGTESGTFDVSIGILPRYVFRRAGKVKVFDAGDAANPDNKTVQVSATGVEWWSPCTSPIPPLTDDACLGPPGGTWDAAGAGGTFTFGMPASIPGAPAEIDPTAEVAPDATIGGGAVIGPGAVVSPGAYVGPRAILGNDVYVGPGAIVGADAQLGPSVFLEDQTVIGSGAIVGDNVSLQFGAAADDGSEVGADAFLEGEAFLGPGSFLGAGAILGEGVHTDAGVSIGPGALVLADVFLAAGAIVEGESPVLEDLLTCSFPGGESFVSTAGACNEFGGAVFECAPTLFEAGADPPGQQLQPGTPTGATRTKLDQDVDSGMVAPNGGGQPYVEDTNDCDDFADDLERHLQGLGYNATFTCYWQLNPDYAWWKVWQSKWINGHCVTDVHLPDGTTVFIEPQFTSGEGAVGQDLDFDKDGKVGVSNGPTSDTTDDGYRIEVYDSQQAAVDAGVDLD